ncbi:hypothetical protein Glove_99g379 [Diversispora epigaea]|uniref:O-acyltransferase WSD1 C-terminal domain-containing protein n=1 Tax=Diversispora epigaea TaxID=1348612 RepID=A0A397J7P4_9GLOM|nr:hypothetical protein Glove_99g379 [Diversispora epigaea]
MNRLKRSHFASSQYFMIKYCPYRNLFRPIMPTIGTNVPGPFHTLTIANQKINKFIAIPPQNGPEGFEIGILSYVGKNNIVSRGS